MQKTSFIEQKIAGWGNFPWAKSRVYQYHNPHAATQIFAQEKNLIPRGLGRSYGDQAINEQNGVLLSEKLNRYIAFNSENGELTCEAGVSFADIIDTFAPRGWFPMITPGTKYITVGGAIANDVHGKAHHVDGSFANCVKEFTILLADGRVLSTSREENEDLFWANFGGLGLLGVILTATIQLRKIETTYFRQQAVKVNNLDELLDALDEYDESYAYSVAWVDSFKKGKSLGKGVLTLGNAAKLDELPPKLKKAPLLVSGPAKLALPLYMPEFSLNRLTVSMLNKAIETTQKGAAAFAHYDKFFYPLDAIGLWNKGYGKKGFIQYQFVIPFENGRENIRTILQKIVTSNHLPFLNVLKKFGEENAKSILSFPMPGYTFAIDFPVRKGLEELTQTLDDMVADFGGRIYLGKDATLSADSFRKMYPQHENWLNIKRKYDPDDKFNSNLSRRLALHNTTRPKERKASEQLHK